MSEDSTVVERRRDTRPAEEPRLFSLVEVAQETGIAMPILLRYKREHPDRIPSVGSGSQQRFPETAFEIFRQIQREEGENRDLPRRGGFGLLSLPRVRKAQSPEPEEEAAPAAAATSAPEPEAPAPTAQSTPAPAAPSAPAAKSAPAATKSAPAATKSAPAATKSAPAATQSEPRPALRRERRPAFRRELSPAAAPARPAAAAPKAEVPREAATLTLGDITDELGIPYPTLARYSNQHEDRIPHVGSGRNRRFPPEAVEVFRRIRAESRPGRPPKVRAPQEAPAAPAAPQPVRAAAPAAAPPQAPAAAAVPAVPEAELARRIESLERSQQALEQEIRSLLEALARPVTATVHEV